MTQRSLFPGSKRESTEERGRPVLFVAAAVAVFLIGAALIAGLGGRGRGATAKGTEAADRARAIAADALADSAGAASCPAAERAVGPAVAAYVKARVPTPQRFLAAVGTPQALPEDGMRALQDRGPTWYFPADSAGQAKVRARLADVGEYTTLLVLYQGITHPGDGRAIVRLGGRYVGAASDGQVAEDESLTLRCTGGAWVVDRTSVERTA